MWDIILDILCAWNLVFALALLIISLMTFLRARKGKFMLISAVFLLFFVKAILASVGLFYSNQFSANSMVPLDCAILVILFFAVAKR